MPTIWNLAADAILLSVGAVVVSAYLIYLDTRSRAIGLMVGILGIGAIYLTLIQIGLVSHIFT